MKSDSGKTSVFSQITSVTVPKDLAADPATGRSPAFEIRFCANGTIPFPQVIVRENGREHIFGGADIAAEKPGHFTVKVAAGKLPPGNFQVQVEGCTKADWQKSGGGDWIKAFGELGIAFPVTAAKKAGAVKVGTSKGVKIYYGIHKHMHQPYYRAADTNYWDGEKDGIFGSRAGNYTQFLKDAVDQYAGGQLPRGGLSTSWSGSLIEQLNRCGAEGLCGGAFGSWTNPLKEAARYTTGGKVGAKRMAFSDFGFFHPLMALIPGRDIVTQIDMHRKIIRDVFGVETSRTLFPPETAFHVRMIPWLNKAGVKAVIYDSVHRYRACKDYPYGGKEEGMLPPNQSEQENEAIGGWMRLTNIWAPSAINPTMLRPEYIKYEDVDGTVHKIIGIPAERYIGNEDARGGYGALQYGSVLGQIYDHIVQTGSFDPKHPPFFLLHSDGDNHGGGADSYYRHNTGEMVEWLKNDGRFELCTVDDYLSDFPPDPNNAVHVEPGSWAGADNGDPQFRKWFSMYDQPYSPDLNSWAVLTALQNCIYTVQDSGIKGGDIDHAVRLLLTAETSCYWYWTGQEIWDRQVTDAANAAMAIVRPHLDKVISAGNDKTAPVIFPPWVTPENPGGQTWGNNCLRDADKEGTVHTFIYDASGLASVTLVIRTKGKEERITMKGGTYPSKTSPAITGEYYTAKLPQGLGDVRYYIEAVDKKKNTAVSSLERIFLA